MKTLTRSPSIFFSPLWLISHLALFSLCILWFIPSTHALLFSIDKNTFFILNGSLLEHPLWQQFWGILNHRKEALLNLMIAALFNLWAILQTKEPQLRKIRIKQTLYFWCCFEIGFWLQDIIFNKLIHINRYSPSLVLQPVVKLASVLNNPAIKDASQNSFPGGHAFSLIYWASFTLLCAPKRVGILGLVFAIGLCLPRLFSGAHWLSDVVFSSLLALVWLSWTIATPIYQRWKTS